MGIKKSSIEQAKADFNEIKDFALQEAMKEVQNKLTPKLDDMINAALNESVSIEAGEVKIEVPSSEEIKISKEDGSEVKISGKSSSESEPEVEPIISDEPEEIDSLEEPSEDSIEDESLEDLDGMEDDSLEDEIEIDMDGDGDDDSEDEEFVVDGDDETEEEEETLAEAEEIALPETPATETPNEPQPQEIQEPVENMTEPMSNPFDAIMQKLENIENKIGGSSTEDGEVEIVDDENTPAPAAPVDPAAAPAPAPVEEPVQEEFLLEMDDEVILPGEEEEEIVAEIVDEEIAMDEDEESLEEMLGVSHTVKNQANRRSEINESKIKAQHESKIDELLKENASLKETINDYKESFIELRSQFNEMQTFNAKLAYANKLFINGGLSTEEKMTISEQFDKVKTIDEAKDLFRKLIKESNTISETKKPVEDKIKSQTINIASPTKSEPLFENKEARRWKILGGIIKESDE